MQWPECRNRLNSMQLIEMAVHLTIAQACIGLTCRASGKQLRDLPSPISPVKAVVDTARTTVSTWFLQHKRMYCGRCWTHVSCLFFKHQGSITCITGVESSSSSQKIWHKTALSGPTDTRIQHHYFSQSMLCLSIHPAVQAKADELLYIDVIQPQRQPQK